LNANLAKAEHHPAALFGQRFNLSRCDGYA
jgi:hypothetical protein